MKKLIITTLVIASALTITYFSSTELTSAENQESVYKVNTVAKAEKSRLIDFTYDDNGTEKSFSDIAKGKIVFLNFWGTWCPPCRGEIPDIIKMQKDLEGKDVLIAGVALERPSTKDKLTRVSNFHSKNKMNYINFVDEDNLLNKAYGPMRFVPTTLIINRDGDIVEVIQGARSYEQFMKSIKKAL
ncbi:MAG: TlpA family protein disulfide reductase [Chlorobiota bacterium]